MRGLFLLGAACLAPLLGAQGDQQHPMVDAEIAELPRVKALDLENRARAFADEGKMDQARRAFSAAIKSDPTLLSPYCGLARVHDRLGQPAAALHCYRQLLDRAKEACADFVPVAAIRMADCLYALGRAEEAYQLYSATLREHGPTVPKREGLAEIVRSMESARSDATIFRLDGVTISPCAKEDYCLPRCVHALFRHWKLPGELETLGEELVKTRRNTARGVLEYLATRPDVGAAYLAGDAATIKDLIRRGFPVIVLHRTLNEGRYGNHASVIVGYDDRRGIFLLEEPNWYDVADRMPFAHVPGNRMLLVSPAYRLGGLSLPASDACRRLNEGESCPEPAEAERLLRDAIALGARLSLPCLYLGRLAQNRGDHAQARAWFEQAASLPGADAEAHAGLGLAWLRLRDPGRARAGLEAAIRFDPGYAAAHKARAELLFRSGDLDGALASARRLIAIRPRDGDAHGLLGAFLKQKKLLGEAERELRLAIFFGAAPSVHYNLAGIYLEQGKKDRAIEHLEAYLRLDQNPADKDRAEEALERLRGRRPPE